MADKEDTVPMQEKQIEVEEVGYMPGEDGDRKSEKSARIRIAIALVAVIVLVAVAFAVGYVVRLVLFKCESHKDEDAAARTSKLIQEAADSISATQIESQLKYFTKVPHVGGSKESHEQALYMQEEWRKYGLDTADLKKYNILLSFPKRPGLASILRANGSEEFRARQMEKTAFKDEEDPRVLPPFNAYSASGNVTGKLIFINYGRVEDFDELKTKGISVAGHIAIAKYGKIFRGDKEKHARGAGAIGLILYSDPQDVQPDGQKGNYYPNSWWLPPTGVQRGSLFINDGDPVTPGYPAVDGVYTIPIKDAGLPQLPVYPISSNDAAHFLGLLTDTKAPNDWQGGLPITYNIMMASGDERNVSLDIEMSLETKPVYNVVGTIKGSVEPDRLVLFGNHRDAWIFGATDPSSGTADLMEIARAFGKLKTESNWRPRRTLVFLSWGAEEHGLHGSTEWVEEFANLLTNRAVAYLNVDISVQGNYSMRLTSSPLMEYTVFEASKKVGKPYSDSGENLYDDWKSKFPDKTNPKIPHVTKVGSGSDYAALYHRLGVPSADFRYTYDTNKYKIASYPVYHSVHDTFHWMKTFVDRDFLYHRAIAQLWVQIGVSLADSVLVPFNCSRYAERLAEYVRDLKSQYGTVLVNQGISLEHLDLAVTNFTKSAKQFHDYLESVDQNDPLAVRMANDRLVQFEKAFVNPQGLPGRPYKRHMIFAPSAHDTYAGMSFPGLLDALYEAKVIGNGDWNQVKMQLTLVTYYIRAVRDLMVIKAI